MPPRKHENATNTEAFWVFITLLFREVVNSWRIVIQDAY